MLKQVPLFDKRRHTAQAVVWLNLMGVYREERSLNRVVTKLDLEWRSIPHVRHVELRGGAPVLVFTKE